MSGSSTVRVLGPEDGEFAGKPGEHHDRFLIGGGETDGRFALVEHLLAPRALAAPLHRHHHEDEYSFILEGAVGVWLGGERSWPEEAPFHTPVFVLTHVGREPWVRPGGTTFFFVTDGPERALERAREAAGARDVRISGGADVIQQYLNLGAIDELEVALAPVLFGGGRRLFENLRAPLPRFRVDKVLHGPDATHLRYVPTSSSPS